MFAGGSAAVVGSGAFSSVSAQRTVEVNVAGDASALLGIRRAREAGNDGDQGSDDESTSPSDATANADEYVNTSGDTVSLDFTGSSQGATGVNQNAETKFKNLLDFLNNGTQHIELYPQAANPGFIDAMYIEGPDDNVINGNPNFPDPDGDEDSTSADADQGASFDPANPVIIPPGESAENFGLNIDTSDGDGPSGSESTTITLTAEATDKRNS